MEWSIDSFRLIYLLVALITVFTNKAAENIILDEKQYSFKREPS